MNNEIQIFNHEEFGEIRTIEIDGQVYFVGLDVAKALGYKNPRSALNNRVDEEDKTVIPKKILKEFLSISEKYLENIPNRGLTVINESGYYSLVLARQINKKDNSEISQKIKRFQRWVTNEVLPTLRKTGTYSMNPPRIEENTTIHTKKLTIKADSVTVENANITNNYIEEKPQRSTSKKYKKGDIKIMDENQKNFLKNQLEDYLQRNGVDTSKKNGFPCLICGSKDGCFLVPEHNKQTWKCFSLKHSNYPKDSGDIIEYVKQLENVDFKRACEILSNMYGLDITDTTITSKPQLSQKEEKIRINLYNMALQNQPQAVDYLKSRGIIHADEIAQEFQIGFMPNYAYEFENDKPSKTTPAVIIPMSDTSYSWRSTTENLKKKSGTIIPLNLKTLTDTLKKWIFLVEGEFDMFSILDIAKDIPNCEFSAICLSSAVNLERFINTYIASNIQENIGLIIALDNDKEPNKNVTQALKKGLNSTMMRKIPCIVADVQSLYLGNKDSNEALNHNREGFKNSLLNQVEKAKTLDIKQYLNDCESLINSNKSTKKDISPQPEITFENIESTEVLEYMYNLTSEIDIAQYCNLLLEKAKMFHKSNFKSLLAPYRKKALEHLKKNKTQNLEDKPIHRCIDILENTPQYKGKIAFNEFTGNIMIDHTHKWTDTEFSKLVYEFEDFGITSERAITHAFNIVSARNTYHPIKDYLSSLKWDGIPRLDTLFIDFLGADDNEYTRKVSAITLIGAVARVYIPGIKFDTMTVLVGKQGTGKSTLFAKLGGEWFSDELNDLKGKEAYESLQGAWIIEIAELSALNHATIEEIKKFITKTIDHYRKPYARVPEDIKRQCIFVGTTNKSEFLKDETGNRRFYPIDINVIKATKSIWNDLTSDYVNQVWAEAMQRYLNKENIYIESTDPVLKYAEFQQRNHFNKDTLFVEIENYLNMLVPPNWNDFSFHERANFMLQDNKNPNIYTMERRSYICIREILIDLYPDDYSEDSKISRRDSDDIAKILEALGWYKNRTGRVKGLKNPQQMYFKSEI